QLADVQAGELHAQGLGPETFAEAEWAISADQIPGDTLFYRGALRTRKSAQHVPPCAGKCALVTGLLFATKSTTGLGGRVAGVNRNGRLVFGKENPVAIFARQ